MPDTEVLVDGLVFPEGPRWHDGRLWFSDMHDKRVKAVDPAGKLGVIVEVPGSPSGLGWDLEGRLLIVSMEDRRLVRHDGDGSLATVADLADFSPYRFNDMVVDTKGRAYTGNFGTDFFAGSPPQPTIVVRVDPDGTATVAADDMAFPNGMVVTPDGGTLIAAESMGRRLTAFDVADDGSLSGRRVWAKLPDDTAPDGICLDAEGAVWVASPLSNDVLRVREGGGEVTERISTVERGSFACMLGGEDGQTLHICTATAHQPDEAVAARSGAIETVRVAVARAGCP